MIFVTGGAGYIGSHTVEQPARCLGARGLPRRCAPRNDGELVSSLRAQRGQYRHCERSVAIHGCWTSWIAASLRSSQ